MLTPDNLDELQKQAIKDIINKKILCNTSDCSAGKTIMTLSAFVWIKKRVPNAKMLVVSKAEGVKNAWSKEYKKWSHTKHLKCVTLVGTPAVRLKLLKQEVDVYAISYNSLKWLSENNPHDFYFVCADEGEVLKGVKSSWRRDLIKCTPNVVYKYITSATPKSREEDDFWGICKYLDGGKRLGETIGEFRGLYMESYTIPGVHGVKWRMRKGMGEIVESKIKDIFINYDMEENKVPIKVITARATLSDESREIYQRLQKEQCLNAVVEVEGAEGVKPLNSLAISNVLNQLTSGFLYVNEKCRISIETLRNTTNVDALIKQNKKRVTIDIFDDRINAFKKLIKQIHKRHGKDQHICICYNFTHELVQLQKAFPEGVSDKEDNIEDRWNNGEMKYLFLQFSRSSRSINLQHGGFIMAMYTGTFKFAEDYQIARRLARRGQVAPCVYLYRLFFKGTIDDIKTTKEGTRFKGHKRFHNLIRRG